MNPAHPRGVSGNSFVSIAHPKIIMRTALVLVSFLLGIVSTGRAAQAPDPVLLEGLRSLQANGLEAGLRVWFADRGELAREMQQALQAATANFGDIIDTEVVSVQTVSQRVTRYYVAIYFQRCPVWLRVERYTSRERAFFLPLKFSTNPDVILPGYVTEFRVP